MSRADFILLLPALILMAGGAVMLLVPFFLSERRTSAADATAITVLAFSFVAMTWRTFTSSGELSLIVSSMMSADAYSTFFQYLLLCTFMAVALISIDFLRQGGYAAWEYHALLLFAAAGCWFLVAATHFASMYISLELLAISSYILAGYYKRERKSNEAAVKYFILGAVSSAILLYGISLVYGAGGTMLFAELRSLPLLGNRVALAGVLMIAAGLCFKIAAAPFHVWTPDVYSGAPTPVTAFLSTASKIAAAAVFGRLFLSVFAPMKLDWQLTIAAIALLSMLIGNVAALTQTNVKRLLAYSSIGQAGYLLLAIIASSPAGIRGLLIYSVVYVAGLLGAWSVVLMLGSGEYGAESVDDFRGLHRRAPFQAFGMLFFLLSLGGIPPTGGFVGKYFLFASAVQSGFGWLAIAAVLTSALSMFYYLRIVVAMYFREGNAVAVAPAMSVSAVAVVCLLVTLTAGIYPQPLIQLVDGASSLLIPGVK